MTTSAPLRVETVQAHAGMQTHDNQCPTPCCWQAPASLLPSCVERVWPLLPTVHRGRHKCAALPTLVTLYEAGGAGEQQSNAQRRIRHDMGQAATHKLRPGP
jgi:hypothetical protein